MYDTHLCCPADRRVGPRLTLQVFLNQYIKDHLYRAFALDISEAGLAVQKLTEYIVPASRVVSLELELPGTREVIWASAETCFDSVGPDFHVSGLRFAGMARKHERLLRDYVRERRDRLARVFGRIHPVLPGTTLPRPT